MRLSLSSHPETPCAVVESLHVELNTIGQGFSLDFVVFGEVDKLRLPPRARAERTDGLWRSTCFEVFVQPAGCLDYGEFNFSPSGQWAAYHFDDYRAGMRDLQFEAPAMSMTVSDRCLRISVPRLSVGVDHGSLGLTAVIEDRAGELSYWALTHPSAKPDFHHPDSFTHSFSLSEKT